MYRILFLFLQLLVIVVILRVLRMMSVSDFLRRA